MNALTVPSPALYRWDDYHAFHVLHVNNRGLRIAQFDTGEMIVQCRMYQLRPEVRSTYTALGLRIGLPSDRHMPQNLALPDGSPCRQMWLRKRQQQMMIMDEQTGIVVAAYDERFSWHGTMTDDSAAQKMAALGIPARFHKRSLNGYGMTCWWGGTGQRPRTLAQIAFTRPSQAVTAAHWKAARAQRDVARAWLVLAAPKEVQRQASYVAVTSVGQPIAVERVLSVPFTELAEAEKLWLAVGRLKAGTAKEYVTHLTVL